MAGEQGAGNVKIVIQDAIEKKIIIKMNQINLLKVYYHVCKIYN
jgi:hypothetical protein